MGMQPSNQTFVGQVRRQLLCLRDPDSPYRALRLHVAGVPEPWEFGAGDDFEFHEAAGLLLVRSGPDPAGVPEFAFRLDAVVACQLVSGEELA